MSKSKKPPPPLPDDVREKIDSWMRPVYELMSTRYSYLFVNDNGYLFASSNVFPTVEEVVNTPEWEMARQYITYGTKVAKPYRFATEIYPYLEQKWWSLTNDMTHVPNCYRSEEEKNSLVQRLGMVAEVCKQFRVANQVVWIHPRARPKGPWWTVSNMEETHA